MQKPTIEIVIRKGKATVHTQGIEGESCTSYTAGIVRRLGGPAAQPEVQLTGEYFGEMGATQPQAEATKQIAN